MFYFFKRDMTMTKRYINVAYKDREMAKRLGARWDASVRRWYCPPGSALAKIYSWRKPSTASSLTHHDDVASDPSMTTIAHVASHTLSGPAGEQLSLLG